MLKPLDKLPKPCFASEHDAADSMCQACPHEVSCKSMCRARTPYINEAKFKFSPPETRRPRQTSFQDEYKRAYSVVFGENADSLARHNNLGERVSEAAATARCTRELFIYAVMAAHKVSAPERKFYANQLAGPVALKRVELYRNTAAARYGVFDFAALSDLTGDDSGRQLEDQMLTSETLVGLWIVKQCIRGVVGDIASELFSQRELAMSPIWGATDSRYLAWAAAQPATQEQARHRAEAERMAGSSTLMRLRERQFPLAITAVCARVDPRLAKCRSRPVITDPAEFWACLGQAAFRLRMLDAVSRGDLGNRPTAFAIE